MRKRKKKTKAKQINYKERVQIETLLGEDTSKREIARKLGREASSIRYEIEQNSVKGKYNADKAHTKAKQRRWRVKKDVLKVAVKKEIKDYVIEKIQQYWSPEAIAGRIANVDTHIPRVGKDAIYAFLESTHGIPLKKYLWYKGKKYKVHTKRGTIDGRVMIDKRPTSALKRKYYGHWEGDFIVSGKGGSGALLVFVERKSRYILIRKLYDRKVATINRILEELFGEGQLVADSLTIDNDISFQKHEEMSQIIGAPIYFCHPYHSWEKGSVEKMNQLIRRFIPKGTNIAHVSEKRVRFVEKILNNRPLKCLGFFTPSEIVARSKKLKACIESYEKILNSHNQ